MSEELGGVPVRLEEPLSRHLPLRAGGAIERWVEVEDERALALVVRAARAHGWALRPIFPFGDALPPEGGLTGVGLRLGRGFERVEPGPDGCVWVGASAPLALAGRLPGFEALARAPGTFGDAWEDGWIAPAVVRVRRFRGRGVEEVEGASPDRKALALAALLQPGVKLSPPRAGQALSDPKLKDRTLMERLKKAGLSGMRMYGAGLSEEDPTVLLNRGGASARQIRILLEVVRERVQRSTGMELQTRLAPPGRGGRL